MDDSHLKAKELFDATAATYHQRSAARTRDFLAALFSRRIGIVESFLDHLSAPGKVLDFGMGPAVFGRPCVDRGLHYIGLDISSKMIEEARALNLQDAEYHVGDLEALEGYRDGVDAVLAIGLLDYLEAPEHGLSLLAACVRPGGSLIVSFRNRRSLPRLLRDGAKTLLQSLFGRGHHRRERAFLAAGVQEHSFDFEIHLRPHLARRGFSDFEVGYFNCSPLFFNFPLPRWLGRAWAALDKRIAGPRTRLLCSGGVLHARRSESKSP